MFDISGWLRGEDTGRGGEDLKEEGSPALFPEHRDPINYLPWNPDASHLKVILKGSETNK